MGFTQHDWGVQINLLTVQGCPLADVFGALSDDVQDAVVYATE
jgi:hypothetical protein